MKNSTLFPFERNKYFYGKLLSVDDFELEQKYGNDKRRALNSYVCGSGIVSGMYVVMVDEQTVSIETGFALDGSGREIAIHTPVIKKLSLIDGFDEIVEAGSDRCYMCVEYDERETTPVYNIAGNFSADGDSQSGNSRIQETYRLYLTSNEPKNLNLSYNSLVEEKVRVFSSDGLTIDHTLSRFARRSDEVELRVDVTNKTGRYVLFSYDCVLFCLSSNGETKLNVSFDEMLFEKADTYTMTYKLRAADATDIEGTVTPDGGSFQLHFDKLPIEGPLKPEGKSGVRLTKADPKLEIIDDYYRSAMETLLKNTNKEGIYVARVHMVKAGDTYVIERVENTPFNQRIMSMPLNAAITKALFSDALHSGGGYGASEGNGKDSSSRNMAPRIASGMYEFELPKNVSRAQRFVSEEVFHGLGLGYVNISLSIKVSEHESVFGSSEVFANQAIRMETAAWLNEDKGSFTIGLRALENTKERKCIVRWTALRSSSNDSADIVQRKIYLKPSILELGLRESHYIEANCVNMTDTRIRWMTAENSGSIDANGHYTAPNIPGVYEVTAQSEAWPEVKATIFVVVREEAK